VSMGGKGTSCADAHTERLSRNSHKNPVRCDICESANSWMQLPASHLAIIVIVAYLVLPDPDEQPPRSGPLWLPELAVACQQEFRHLGAAARQSVALFAKEALGLLTA